MIKSKVNQVLSGRIGQRIVKILRFGRSDVLTPTQVAPHGIDSHPVKNMTAIQAETATLGETIVVGYINTDLIAEAGEIHLFSTNSDGAEQFRIKLTNNGEAHIGGDADFAVRFNELETGFNQFRGDFNDFISTFNSHVHNLSGVDTNGVAVSGATTNLSTPLATNSTASISSAKVDNVKLP